MFTLEDYRGTHEFKCFGEDYVKFKEFMVEGWMVILSTRVQEQGYGREGLRRSSSRSSCWPMPARNALADCEFRCN